MIRVATFTKMATISKVVAAGSVMLALSACEFGHKKIEQTGYRGTGGDQIIAVNRLVAQPVPPPPYASPDDSGPRASETYQNVKVLGGVSTERFNHLMASITTWIAPPEQGCNYCHNPNNMASDELYTKVVARRMLQMTINLNQNWKPHVKETGVTCYTCHAGNAIPKNVWAMADAPAGGPVRLMSNKHGQDTPAKSVAYASLPYDPFTPYLADRHNIRVVGVTPLRGPTPGKSIASTERTYALMMHMSSALNVNCTFCHNADSFASWSNSRPQRAQAWYGLRMVAQINNQYISSLSSVFPANRKGPHGDVYKVNCSTCHQGLNKPLGGVSMLKDYPVLRGTPTTAPAVAAPIPAATPPSVAPVTAATDTSKAAPTSGR